MSDKDVPIAGGVEVESRWKVWFNRLGLFLAVAFFAVSVVMVIRNHGGVDVMFSGDTKVITLAHWQLEDGFREGFEEAIAIYEKEKAEQGVKVKVRQVAVPVRGYPQWFLTQLIGGEPADVIELTGSADLWNQYLTPLSPYIGRKNPWNKGTPLEEYSWRESFVDDMLSAFDATYSEYFGVCIFMHTNRLYVNMDLFHKACGPDAKLPATLTEWLAACDKVREYGKQTGKAVIPIGVRGFDKSSLAQLLSNYNSQMNADYADTMSPFGHGLLTSEVYRQVNSGELSKKKLLAPVELVTQIGQYFAEGFSAIDLEQTKFLFASGNVAFFLDGTWNAWSMVNNSPFPVEVIRMPELDKDHPMGKDAFGQISELGAGVSGRFGVPKKTRNFDLALDFLRFITSYRVSKLTMIDHCRWMSSLKGMEYEGLMQRFVPVTNTSHIPVTLPFNLGTYTNRKTLQWAERGIIRNPPDPAQAFWVQFLDDRRMIIDEQREAAVNIRRTLWNMDATRSALTFGLEEPGLDPAARELLEMRNDITMEGVISRWRALDNQENLIIELGKLQAGDQHGD